MRPDLPPNVSRRETRRSHGLSLLLLSFCSCLATGAEPEVDSSQLPRVPPTEPAQAPATFKIKPGFRLELAAAEPEVVSPVAMSFDEDGRLFVIEMRDYSERRPERLGRVRMLEDADGDGRFEKSTVFAQDLPWPTAVTCWAGGVFVGATPDILYLKDTDGDGVADVREIVFTGFASDYAPFATNKLNVQALMNSFQWTLENRIHGATSFSGGKVRLVDSPFVRDWIERGGARAYVAFRDPKPLDLRGRDFSFDPRTLDLRAESGGGQHGMSFDDRGRKFVCSNSDHIQQVVYEDRYAARNPWFTLPSPRVSIAVDGPAAEVYRLSPDEPWRVLRTAWRVSGQVKGPIEGGGRASGYFTGATGLTIYRGDAYGEEFVGDAFIGDAGGNLVHRKKLRPDGMVLRAERPADEPKVEFLASTDNWFRPVQFANGPDGCLYIADMYREVIEHPWSLPANLKKHLDLNSGEDRGRIWRIAPESFSRPKPQRLSRLSAKAVTPLLSHRNGWMRDTAARLLYERQDARALPALRELAQVSAEPPSQPASERAALPALYALAGMGQLTEDLVVALVSTSTDEAIRGPGLKLLEPFLKIPSGQVVAALRALSQPRRDAPPTMEELQLVFTLGELRRPLKLELFAYYLDRRFLTRARTSLDTAAIAKRDLAWIGPAVLSGMGDDPAALAEELLSPVTNELRAAATLRHTPNSKTGFEIFALVGRATGALNRSNGVVRMVQCTSRISPEGCAVVLGGIEEGLRQRGESLVHHPAMAALTNRLRLANQMAMPPGGQLSDRLDAIRLLAFASDPESRSNLLHLVGNTTEWKDCRSVALASLARSGDPEFAADVLRVWPQLTPTLRADALKLFMPKAAYLRALLQAVQDGRVPRTELSIERQAALRSHPDRTVRALAQTVLGKPPEGSRQSVVDKFQPALQLQGDSANGRKTFLARCATCHTLDREGHALGPDLATVRNGGKEKLLIAILDPNREVAPNFAAYDVETKDGESLSGILASESAASVTLRMAGGAESVIARANLARLQSQGRSLMPEGLEEGLTAQDLADLLGFILSPTARP